MADESTEPVVGRLGVEVWRTAKATGINRKAAKSRCARQWGGWGRLREDGPGHYNPDRSEDPWGRAAEATRTEVFQRAISPDTERGTRCGEQGARRAEANQTLRSSRSQGTGRPRLTHRPGSRTGETPPYGILGRTMETSASFEARSAPSFYPAAKRRRQRATEIGGSGSREIG